MVEGKTLTLQPKPEKQHRVALHANLVDIIFEPVPVYHAATVFQMNACVAVQIHRDDVLSMNFVC